MRRILFSVFVLVMAAALVASADDGSSAKAASKAAGCCAGGKMKASCAQAMAAQVKSEGSEKVDAGHVCPDVTGRTALMEFHEAMHPMHMALGASDFNTLREGLPQLLEASKEVKDYKCAGYENCPKDARKNFDGRRSDLMKAVKNLKKACKGKDDEKVAEKFNIMHEAYIALANACVRDDGSGGEAEKMQ